MTQPAVQDQVEEVPIEEMDTARSETMEEEMAEEEEEVVEEVAEEAEPSPEPVATPDPEPEPEPASPGLTMAVVATHNSATSCWSVINGSVYDLTSWINQHPGGSSRILAICGIDGSSAFNGQHGGQGGPTSTLSGFLLGPLE